MSRSLAAALTAAALVWGAALVVAPAAIAARSRTSLPAAYLYHAAGSICHQRPDRSFQVAGVRQPVCARCFGLYASGAIAAAAAWAPRRRRIPGRSRERTLLLLCAVPTALTWSLEAAGVMGFSNAARALAALPLGAAAGWIFVRGLRSTAIS